MSKIEVPSNVQLFGKAEIELAGPADPGAQQAPGIEQRQFYMHAYTGAPVSLGFGMQGIFDLKGMDVSPSMPILQQHNHEKIVGLSKERILQHDGLHLRGPFLNTKAAQEVISLGDQKFPWQASIGVAILQAEYVEEDEKRTVNGLELSGPFIHVTKSRVKESSFVPLGADGQTRSVVLGDETAGTITVNRREKIMEKVPATVAELKKAFPEDPSFALKHLELGSSLLEAKADYADVLQEKVKELNARGPKTTPTPLINTRLGGDEDSNATSPTEEWNEKLALEVAKFANVPDGKYKAVRSLAKREPKLHAAYLEEYNSSYKPRRKA